MTRQKEWEGHKNAMEVEKEELEEELQKSTRQLKVVEAEK